MTTWALTLVLSTLAHAGMPPVVDPLRSGAKAPQDAAVVIGNQRYAFLPEVPFATRDANAFYNLMVYTRGIPEDRVQLLTASSREQILAAVERAAGQVDAGGRVWVYFAGHGGADPATGERLLLGDDTKADAASWRARALAISELEGVLGTDEAVVVLDACFNGSSRGGQDLSGQRFAVPAWAAPTQGKVTIWASASSDQLSSPFDAAGHGLFTYFAVGALRGWADGELSGERDGVVSLAEAQAYASRAMRSALPETPQQPQLLGDGALQLAERAPEEGPDLAALVAAPVVDAGWSLDASEEHVIRFESVPDGAAVSVDGAYLCDTPCSRALGAGAHGVEFALERHDPLQKQLEVVAPKDVRVELVPRFGYLSVRTEPPGLQLLVDGQSHESPLDRLVLGHGAHRVEVRDERWKVLAQTVTIEKGVEAKVELTPDPRIGGLKVVVRDKEGNDQSEDVRVDGSRVGRAPWTGEIQVGRHVVQAGDAKSSVLVREAEIEQIVLTTGPRTRGTGVPLVVAGSTLGAAGLATAVMTWTVAPSATNDTFGTLQTLNGVGVGATALGAALATYGAARGEKGEGLGAVRASVVTGAVALAGAGTALGAGLYGQSTGSVDGFERARMANGIGWAVAGASAAATGLVIALPVGVEVRPLGAGVGLGARMRW